MKYANTAASSASWTLKCTDLAQFDALQAAAESFRNDDKLHLRNLCNDTSRCAGLIATHSINDFPRQGHPLHRETRSRKIILDYSRQRVTGETMELLFDLADAVALTDRREAMRLGVSINATGEFVLLALDVSVSPSHAASCTFRGSSGFASYTSSS